MDMNLSNEQKIAALEALADDNGDVDADRVWKAAQSSNHLLHGLKEWRWDEHEAAVEHWRYIARRIIASCHVRVTFHEVEFSVPKYVRDPSKPYYEQGYAMTHRIADDNELARTALESEISRIEGAIKRALALARALDLEREFERMMRQATAIRHRVRPDPVE